MRSLLLLSLVLLGVGQISAKKEDWFHNLLKTRTNWSANPCDNFYRFVCPRMEESPSTIEDKIDYLSQSFGKLVALDEAADLYPIDEWIHAQCPGGNKKCWIDTILKVYSLLGSSNKPESFPNMFKRLEVLVQGKTRRILPMVAMSFWHEEFVKESNMTIADAYERANLMMQSIQRQVGKMLMHTSYSKKNRIEKQRLQTNLRRHKANDFNLTQIISDEQAAKMSKIVTEALILGKNVLNGSGLGKEPKGNNFWSTTIALALDAGRIGKQINEWYPNVTKEQEEGLRILLYSASILNAANAMGNDSDILLLGGELLKKTLYVNKYPLSYAMLAHTFGHEVFHSYFRDVSSNYMSPEALKRADCIIRNSEETCKILGEESCSSGRTTISEDGPDLEGVRAAYLQYRHKFAPKFKDQVYKDVQGMNYEQAFFFAYAGFWCQKYSYKEQHRTDDVHSGLHIRTQIIFRQMPQFAKAFDCPAESPMRAKEICHVFGDELFQDE